MRLYIRSLSRNCLSKTNDTCALGFRGLQKMSDFGAPQDEKFRFIPKLAHLWAVLPFFIILTRSFRETVPLLDFWWHLKLGQVITETGAIPRTDIFSFTAAGKLFVVHNWFAEILYYGTYKVGGLALVVFAHGLLLASALIPVQTLCWRWSRTRWTTVLSMSLVSLFLPANMRPQVFSYLFFAFFYFIVISW